MSSIQKNVFRKPLVECGKQPLTGFYRDGYCHLSAADTGNHGVCAIMDANFLDYTKWQGNDLSTPRPEWGFAGLNPGDRWCLCIDRWMEAYRDNKAPKLVLDACHENLLKYVSLEELQSFNQAH